MLRRNVRLRREYLYRKSLEGKERQLYENNASSMKTRSKFAKLYKRESLFQLSSEMKRRPFAKKLISKMNKLLFHIQPLTSAADRDPKILLTTSRDPSAPLTQFVKELKIVFPNA